MKKVYTEQKSANRGPRKYCSNYIQAIPVAIRRQQEILGADHAEWDRTYDDKIARRNAKQEHINKVRNGVTDE